MCLFLKEKILTAYLYIINWQDNGRTVEILAEPFGNCFAQMYESMLRPASKFNHIITYTLNCLCVVSSDVHVFST